MINCGIPLVLNMTQLPLAIARHRDIRIFQSVSLLVSRMTNLAGDCVYPHHGIEDLLAGLYVRQR